MKITAIVTTDATTSTPTTPGTLADIVGTHLLIEKIGPLQESGKRKADSAWYTANKAVAVCHLKKVKAENAKTKAAIIAAQEQAQRLRAAPPRLQGWSRKNLNTTWAKEYDARAARLQHVHEQKLNTARARIKATGDLSAVSEDWLIAYSEMLDGDSGYED